MTPEQITKAIEAMLEEHGYQLLVDVVDSRNGLNITQALAEQWGYVVQVKVAGKEKNAKG